jgi:hypothetical protein
MTNPTSGIRLSDDWDDSGWVQVPRNILRDRTLTFKAMGLVAYLASHMAGFRINREFLYRASANGKDAVESGLKELRTAGYLTVERVRDGRGLLTADTDYVLHRYPVGAGKDQCPENPDAGDSNVRVFPNQENPESGKPATKGDSVLSETQEDKGTLGRRCRVSTPTGRRCSLRSYDPGPCLEDQGREDGNEARDDSP